MTDKKDLALRDQPVTMNTLKALVEASLGTSTPTLPKRYLESDTPIQDMWAAVLVGREIGIREMESINSIFLVNGSVSMYGKLMTALIFRAGHIISVRWDAKAQTATVICQRWHRPSGQLVEVGQVSFSAEDAERAGIDDKDTYKKYPRAMIQWRAVTEAARLYYSDCIAGIGYVPEEVGLDDVPIEELPENIIDADTVSEGSVADYVRVIEAEEGEIIDDD